MHILLAFSLVALPFTVASPPSSETNSSNIAKPGCQTQCGNLTVQYPFGIGVDSGCSIGELFDINCNTSFDSPKAFIRSTNIQIYNITESEMRIASSISWRCYNRSRGVYNEFLGWTRIINLPFSFSEKNKFTVVGCDDYALITGTNGFASGCFGLCSKAEDVPTDGSCSGIGCCQTSIPKGLNFYNITLLSLGNHTNITSFNPCGFAFLGEQDSFVFRGARDLSNASEFLTRVQASVPILLDWAIGGNRTCGEATECKANSFCIDADGGGYRCSCVKGYQGNPYLDPGCRDINECEDKSNYQCFGVCFNTPGGYNCTCPQGYSGDARTPDGCISVAKRSKFPVTAFTLGMVFFGFFTIFSGVTGLYFCLRKRKLIKLREKYFERNGDVLLRQKIKLVGAGDAVTIFSFKDLQKATDNFSNDKIVGQGGYGTVYKGILPDGRTAVIKKTRIVDWPKAEQFVDEVMICTRIIHQNMVQFFGCCLETEVPLLVYEFISNNTLFHHIHEKSGGTWLSWENRLRVAAEAAGALAYFHSADNIPIIHRDVKSSNILLDDNYTAKISDFGASRLVPLDHDHLTTVVQGTLGYLDPEYFHTSQLTDKSDVYSFGVVLAELVTGKKVISLQRREEERNLASYFIKSMKENRLFEIVDPRVLHQGNLDQLQAVAELVNHCLKLRGDDRPTMKEVAMELEGLRKFTTHPWINQQRHEETRSTFLEIEQSDLYGVPSIPSSDTHREFIDSDDMTLQGCKQTDQVDTIFVPTN